MNSASSTLMLDEYFEAGDDRFLEELLGSTSDKKLKAVAAQWYGDARPFARRTLKRYIDDGCDRPHHRPLVKALFKAAERAGDDELMGHFLAAFDRLARRTLSKRTIYDWNTRQTYDTWVLLPAEPALPARAPRVRGQKTAEGYPLRRPLPRFSMNSRRYLQRRAWRYFRKLGFRDLPRYGKAIRATLALYRDDHLTKPEALLDAWGLMHALYWGACLRTRKGAPPGAAHTIGMPAVLLRKPRGIEVAEGRTMTELVPAPFKPEAWKGCFDELVDLVERAHSRTVRAFVIAVLERDCAEDLKRISASRLMRLLKCPHPEVQVLGARLLRTATGLENWALSEWLELLAIEDAQALSLICEAVQQHVAPERLSLAHCVELARSTAAAVAELGLSWAKGKPVRSEADLQALLPIARAPAPMVRAAAVEWLCQLLLLNEKEAKPEYVRELIDSRFDDVRTQGMALMAKDSRFKDSTVLWVAMAETPYADVRQALVLQLEARQKLYAPETLRSVWASALLAVHRGGRAKRAVAAQVAERITRRPDEVDSLLPLLGYALRSVRATERRTALAALTRAAFTAPALQAAIARTLPELKLVGQEASR